MPQNLTNESGDIDNNVEEMNNYFGDLSLWNQKQKNYTASIFQNNNSMNYPKLIILIMTIQIFQTITI